MSNFKTLITFDNVQYYTLADILPEKENLDILFVGKTPAEICVEVGLFFKSKHGIMFWNKLADFDILKVPVGAFADECLIANNYGITDIVKIPRKFGNEPSDEEYKIGFPGLIEKVTKFRPKVIVFVYKGALDKLTRLTFNLKSKSKYGFNPNLDRYFGSKIFVFPMPGTPCKSEDSYKAMIDLKHILKK